MQKKAHSWQNAIEDVTVYKEPGKFCGWPANNGAWSWGDEILVCFDLHHFKEPIFDIDPTEHHVDWKQPFEIVMARSLDGGKTWNLEKPQAFSPKNRDKQPAASPGGINFTHPDFAMRVRGNNFHISYDRGKNWQGPYLFGDFGPQTGARTDYIVNSKDDCILLFRIAADSIVCLQTTDAGKTFQIISDNIAPSSDHHAIMPATVRISEKELITALRQIKGEPYVSWIDIYKSADNGRTWSFLSKVADADDKYWNGNPPSMIKLRDGRIAIAYGFRAVPYGIRAKISSDNGKTWSPEMILREDGRDWDLGYSRTVQRSDGKIVTMYYFATEEDHNNRILATIWDPNTINPKSIEAKLLNDIADYIDAVEQNMNKLNELSAGEVKSVNPLVAQFKLKEKNCDMIRKIIAYNFLSQRIEQGVGNYTEQVTLLQQLLHYNMQAKKTSDLKNIRKMRSILKKFRKIHFSAE